MSDPKAVVRRGYDELGPRYYDWTNANDPDYREQHIAEILAALPDGSSVLDLGCGAGRPLLRAVTERHRYVGVDFSKTQLDLAHTHMPRAGFIQADMTDVGFAPHSFDVVVAFYSIIHVPRSEQAALIRKIAMWLRGDGVFVGNFATRNEADGSDAWIDDVRMFWSSFDPDTSIAMVEASGLKIERAQVLDNFEDGRVARFLWIRARRR